MPRSIYFVHSSILPHIDGSIKDDASTCGHYFHQQHVFASSDERGDERARRVATLRAMRLGHTTKYALEALAYLIRTYARDEWGQIAEIAGACEIPRKYLEQVLLDLKNAGLVESKKGQRGGYRLSRSPDEISLAQVLAAVHGELVPLPDWIENDDSSFARHSGLRDVIEQARAAVERTFEATSIEVLVCRPESWLD